MPPSATPKTTSLVFCGNEQERRPQGKKTGLGLPPVNHGF